MPQSDETRELTQRLIAEGKLIEAGWVSFRLQVLPANTSHVQLEAMRDAFFAGAHYLLRSVMGAMDAGAEPTASDNLRMEHISKELEQFVLQLVKRINQGG